MIVLSLIYSTWWISRNSLDGLLYLRLLLFFFAKVLSPAAVVASIEARGMPYLARGVCLLLTPLIFIWMSGIEKFFYDGVGIMT